MVDIRCRPNPSVSGATDITLNVLLVYYDTVERLVIRDGSFGGLGRGLISQGKLDLV